MDYETCELHKTLLQSNILVSWLEMVPLLKSNCLHLKQEYFWEFEICLVWSLEAYW